MAKLANRRLKLELSNRTKKSQNCVIFLARNKIRVFF